MELGATVCRPRRPAAARARSRRVRAAGRRSVPARRGGRAERFEDTDRWARGRVVAALVAGEALPADIAPERLERALAGLVRDGLVRRVEGSPALR